MLVIMLACLVKEPGACKEVRYTHPGNMSVMNCAAAVRQAREIVETRGSQWKIDNAMCIRMDRA